MQDFRHLNTSDNELPDTTALVQTELQQLQTALRSAQRQIKWQVHQPVSMADIEKRIKQIKSGSIIGTLLFQLPFMAYLYFYLFDTDTTMKMILLVSFVVLLLAETYAYFFWAPKAMRKNNIHITFISLDIDQQKVFINEQQQLKFHSNKSLPAFILPANANADLRHLRDDVQNRITQITGLTFTA